MQCHNWKSTKTIILFEVGRLIMIVFFFYVRLKHAKSVDFIVDVFVFLSTERTTGNCYLSLDRCRLLNEYLVHQCYLFSSHCHQRTERTARVGNFVFDNIHFPPRNGPNTMTKVRIFRCTLYNRYYTACTSSGQSICFGEVEREEDHQNFLRTELTGSIHYKLTTCPLQ